MGRRLSASVLLQWHSCMLLCLSLASFQCYYLSFNTNKLNFFRQCVEASLQNSLLQNSVVIDLPKLYAALLQLSFYVFVGVGLFFPRLVIMSFFASLVHVILSLRCSKVTKDAVMI